MGFGFPCSGEENAHTVRKIEAGTTSKAQEVKLTQNQLHELLETEPARALLDGAEERGFLSPTELEAFALEHDLADDEVELLTRGPQPGVRKVRRPRGQQVPAARALVVPPAGAAGGPKPRGHDPGAGAWGRAAAEAGARRGPARGRARA